MSYDPSDDRTDADYYAEHPEEQDMDARYGADMMDAVNSVIVNVFQERWEDDDEWLAVKTLAEAYTQGGYSARRVEEYAASEVRGYLYEAVDQTTYGALLEAGLWEPVNH